MTNIPGRPKKAVRQEKFLGFFATQQQHFVIQQKASRAGANISDYLRKTAVFGKITPRWTAEEREIFKGWVDLSNGVNQLAGIARQEGLLNTMLYFERYRDKIDQIIKKLDHDQ